MLNMTEKALVGCVIVFAVAVTASVVLPVWTYEARLVTNPTFKHFSLPAGKPFSITCKGDSGEDRYFSNMKWFNPKGEALPDGNPGVEKIGDASLKLSFSTPKVGDSGVYRCVALYDQTLSLQIEVTIDFYSAEPKFESTYESRNVTEGSNLSVFCSAAGEQPITYEWYNQYEQELPTTSDPRIHVSSSENGSSLNIVKVSTTDDGVYTCIATNEFGLSSKLFLITVLPASGNDTDDYNTTSVQNVRTLKITQNSVVFAISTSGSEVKYIQVKYSENRNSTEYQMEWKLGDVYKIEDLIPAGLYSFQFRTSPGNSTWSDIYQVTLLPEAPEVIFQNLEGNSVKLEWFRKLDDIMRGTTDKFQLTYYTVQMEQATNWKPSDCKVTIEIPSCFGSSYTISGLLRKMYYELQFRAHTASGFGEPYKQKFYLE